MVIPVLWCYISGSRLAEMYMVSELSNAAYDRFCKDGDTYWRYSEFADAVKEVYTADTVSERFRDAVLAIAEKHFQELAVDKYRYASFWQAADETPRFAGQLLRNMSHLMAPEHQHDRFFKRYRCPGCFVIFRAEMNAEEEFAHGCGGRGRHKATGEEWEAHVVE